MNLLDYDIIYYFLIIIYCCTFENKATCPFSLKVFYCHLVIQFRLFFYDFFAVNNWIFCFFFKPHQEINATSQLIIFEIESKANFKT